MESIFTSVKGFVSKSIDQLDEIATLDEKKWKKRINTLQATLISEPKRYPSRKTGNYQAGTELLYKYELEWTKIHQADQIIVKRATDADVSVTQVLKACAEVAGKFAKVNSHLGVIPKIRAEISKTNALIVAITKQITDLEVLADDFELELDKRDLRAWEKQQLAEFSDYTSQKNREVKAREFLLKKERESLEAAIYAEKQQFAEEAFQQDLEAFVAEPKPRSASVISTSSMKSMDEELKEALQSIEVEKDEKEISEFLEFLDSNPNNSEASLHALAGNDEEERSVEILKDADFEEESK